MKNRRKNYQTQWAGQFGVAHELSRRGYLVTFTTGNAPTADLLCRSPRGASFSVEVKSLSSKTYFLFREGLLRPNDNQYVIFVLVPAHLEEKPEYHVLTNAQFRLLVEKQARITKEMEKDRGKPYAAFTKGISYPLLAEQNFRGAWDNLPP